MEAGKLRGIREREGVQRAELARLSEVSERTLRRAEAGQTLSLVMQSRIVNALNRLPHRLKDYTSEDVFQPTSNDGVAKEG